jgi:hypothetical protein
VIVVFAEADPTAVVDREFKDALTRVAGVKRRQPKVLAAQFISAPAHPDVSVRGHRNRRNSKTAAASRDISSLNRAHSLSTAPLRNLLCPFRPGSWQNRPNRELPSKRRSEVHPVDHAISGEAVRDSLDPGGFAFSPHSLDAHDRMLWMLLLAVAARVHGAKNAG